MVNDYHEKSGAYLYLAFSMNWAISKQQFTISNYGQLYGITWYSLYFWWDHDLVEDTVIKTKYKIVWDKYKILWSYKGGGRDFGVNV